MGVEIWTSVGRSGFFVTSTRSTVLNGWPVTGALVIRADSPAAPLSLSARMESAGRSTVGPSAANADAARAAIEAPKRRERTRFMGVSLFTATFPHCNGLQWGVQWNRARVEYADYLGVAVYLAAIKHFQEKD